MKKIIPLFFNAARMAGFQIAGSWDKRGRIIFRCLRGKRNHAHYNQVAARKRRPTQQLKNPQNEPIKRNRKSQRPSVLEETCKHNFKVYWDNMISRWFVPKQQSGSIRHNGHPCLDPSLIRLPRHALLPEEICLPAREDASSALRGDDGPVPGSKEDTGVVEPVINTNDGASNDMIELGDELEQRKNLLSSMQNAGTTHAQTVLTQDDGSISSRSGGAYCYQPPGKRARDGEDRPKGGEGNNEEAKRLAAGAGNPKDRSLLLRPRHHRDRDQTRRTLPTPDALLDSFCPFGCVGVRFTRPGMNRGGMHQHDLHGQRPNGPPSCDVFVDFATHEEASQCLVGMMGEIIISGIVLTLEWG